MTGESRVEPSGVSRRSVLSAGAGAALLGTGPGMTGNARARSRTSDARARSRTSSATTSVVNVKSVYGSITQATLTRAIADAKAQFSTSPSDTVVLDIDPGRWVLNNSSGATDGIIDLSNVHPGAPDGRLIIRGGGQSGTGATILEFDGTIPNLYGKNVHQVTVQSMHMTQTNMKVSQGFVHRVEAGNVYLNIQAGFPTPGDIYDPTRDFGRYLRAYDNTDRADPHIIDNDTYPSPTNRQIQWDATAPAPEPDIPNIWRMKLHDPLQVADYRGGQLIGIKSKHGGDAYWFGGGSDFVFDDVMWTGETRGVFRLGFNHVRISNCTIRRGAAINGQAPALASPGGGPQLGQPDDAPVTGMTVENCTFVAPGDDVVGCFNAAGVIRNNLFRDGFARFVLVNSPNMQFQGQGNTIVRTPTVILCADAEDEPPCDAVLG